MKQAGASPWASTAAPSHISSPCRALENYTIDKNCHPFVFPFFPIYHTTQGSLYPRGMLPVERAKHSNHVAVSSHRTLAGLCPAWAQSTYVLPPIVRGHPKYKQSHFCVSLPNDN